MKARSVGVFEAKTHLSALLDEVEKGATVYITRHGQPIAELRPAARARRARFGSARGKAFRMAPDFDAPLEDFRDYEP